MADDTPAGWYDDPSRRHEYRYWDGRRWTDRVANNGITSIDSVPRRQSPIAGSSEPGSVPTRSERQSAQRRAPAHSASGGRSAGAIVVLAGGAVLILGALLPWATASIGFVSVSKAGTSGDGVITLIIGLGVLAIGWVALARRRHQAAVVLGIIAGVIAGGVAIYDIANVSSAVNRAQTRSSLVHASVGIGLWVTALAAAGVIAGSIMKAKEKSIELI
jgi:Protein of unknown function (DUF2510)